MAPLKQCMCEGGKHNSTFRSTTTFFCSTTLSSCPTTVHLLPPSFFLLLLPTCAFLHLLFRFLLRVLSHVLLPSFACSSLDLLTSSANCEVNTSLHSSQTITTASCNTTYSLAHSLPLPPPLGRMPTPHPCRAVVHTQTDRRLLLMNFKAAVRTVLRLEELPIDGALHVAMHMLQPQRLPAACAHIARYTFESCERVAMASVMRARTHARARAHTHTHTHTHSLTHAHTLTHTRTHSHTHTHIHTHTHTHTPTADSTERFACRRAPHAVPSQDLLSSTSTTSDQRVRGHTSLQSVTM
jgi:hypothetical protein